MHGWGHAAVLSLSEIFAAQAIPSYPVNAFMRLRTVIESVRRYQKRVFNDATKKHCPTDVGKLADLMEFLEKVNEHAREVAPSLPLQ